MSIQRQTHTLSALSTRTLARDETRPSIEYERRWFNWGEMRHVANRVGTLISASGAPPDAPVALIARNRPSAA